MFDWNWITTSGSSIVMVLISGVAIFAVLILLTRLTGLRSLSKMSSFDFAMTIALGSVIAATLLQEDPPVVRGAFGLAVLYGIQYAISKGRRVSRGFEGLVDNTPLLVMAHGEILSDNLRSARMTEDDLVAKLRFAGVTHPQQVLAVVFETTGDVSVIRADGEVDPMIFRGIRGADRLRLSSAPIVSTGERAESV